MSASKKFHPNRPPRHDATLKNLPEERQAEVVEHLKLIGVKDTKRWLAEDGVTTSVGALSEFWRWWDSRQQFAATASEVETILENLREEQPELNEAQLFSYGQQVFGVLALKEQKTKDWAAIQNLRQNEATLGLNKTRTAVMQKRAEQAEAALKLAREQFEFAASKAVKANLEELQVIAQRSDLDDDGKLEQIRLKLFGRKPE